MTTIISQFARRAFIVALFTIFGSGCIIVDYDYAANTCTVAGTQTKKECTDTCGVGTVGGWCATTAYMAVPTKEQAAAGMTTDDLKVWRCIQKDRAGQSVQEKLTAEERLACKGEGYMTAIEISNCIPQPMYANQNFDSCVATCEKEQGGYCVALKESRHQDNAWICLPFNGAASYLPAENFLPAKLGWNGSCIQATQVTVTTMK